MGFWVILDIVYAIVNNEMASKKIRIFMQIFFHISFIAAAFIAGIISVFEVFFRKMKIIEIYKHLYEVVCSVVSAIYLGMSSSWLIIKVVEKRYHIIYQSVNWDFVVWIICFLLIKYLYRVFLMLLVRTDKKIDGKATRKNIHSEMEIPFYIILIFSMIIIWGGDFQEIKGMEEYINASTVWVLFATLEKRMIEEN